MLRFAKLYYLLPFLFLQLSAISQKQSFQVQLLRHNDLLSPGQIEEIIRDRRGFLWTLLPSGVQRFDGKNFKTFSFDDRCVNFLEDARARLWLVTRQRLLWFKNNHTGFIEVPGTMKQKSWYRQLAMTSDKQIYLLHVQGIERWSEEKQRFEPFGLRHFNGSGSYAFLKAFGHFLYYGHDNHLYRTNTKTLETDSISIHHPNYATIINSDSIWVRSGVGSSFLACFKTKTKQPVTLSQFNGFQTTQHLFITSGFSLSPGIFFVLLHNLGPFIYNSGRNQFTAITFFHHGRPLQDAPSMNGFFVEGKQAWFPCKNSLVNFRPYEQQIQLFRSGNDPATTKWNSEVRCLTEDDKGNIWFGTANGFCRWNKQSGEVRTWLPRQGASDYLNFPSVRSLAWDKGKLIVGQSEGGFWIFDPVQEKFTRPVPYTGDTSVMDQLTSDFNMNIHQLTDGNFLLLSRNVYQLQSGTYQLKKLDLAAGRSRTSYRDAQQRIWFVGERGVVVTDAALKVIAILKDSILGRWANAIVQIDENSFWLASKGIYKLSLEGTKISYQTIFPELKKEHISGLFKDSLGRIWMANVQGFFRYLPGRQLLEKFDAIDNAQNFSSTNANSYRGKDGTVYFASLNGINYFKPEQIPPQQATLMVQLLNVKVGNDDSTYLQTGALPTLLHDQNSLAFDFVSPQILNAGKVQYRYRLFGSDSNWVHIGNNTTVQFSSLSPGKYRFEVAASLNGKDWYEMQEPVAFAILPPYWRRPWFILSVDVLVLILAIAFIRHRIRQIEERDGQKIAFEKLRSNSLQYELEIQQVINYFTTSMEKFGTVDAMLWDVARNCISKLAFEDCVIYLLDEEKNSLQQKAAWGPKTTEENKIINPIEIPLGAGIVGTVAMTGRAEKIDDTSKDPRYIVDDAARASELTVPIYDGDKVIGIIDSEHSEKHFYTDRHLQILTTIASHCGARITTIKAENKSAAAKMEALINKQKALEASLQSMRLQMNPHFLFNALNSIQQMILSGEETNATRFLSKFSKLLRTVLTNSSKEDVLLKEEVELLQLYIELEALRFKDTFTYTIEIDENIDAEETFVPSLLIQPLVENAIWHGLMHKTGQRKLAIRFRQCGENYLLCTVEDNGVGMQASKLNGGEQAHTGKGLTVAMDRLQTLNEKNGTKNNLQVIDLKTENDKPAGTRVDILLYY